MPRQSAYTEKNFEDCLCDRLHGWAFRQLLSGRLAWVSRLAEEGDIVFLAKGTPLPLIIRAADES
jgi:hypothetical protein